MMANNQQASRNSASQSPDAQSAQPEDSASEDELPLWQVMAQRRTAAPSSRPSMPPTLDAVAAATIISTDAVQPDAAAAGASVRDGEAAHSSAALLPAVASALAEPASEAAAGANEQTAADSISSPQHDGEHEAATEDPTAATQDLDAEALIPPNAAAVAPDPSVELVIALPSHQANCATPQHLRSDTLQPAHRADSAKSMPGDQVAGVMRESEFGRFHSAAISTDVEPMVINPPIGADASAIDANSRLHHPDDQQQSADPTAALARAALPAVELSYLDRTEVAGASPSQSLMLQMHSTPSPLASMAAAAAADTSETPSSGADAAQHATGPVLAMSAWAEPLEQLLDCSLRTQAAALLLDVTGVSYPLATQDILDGDVNTSQPQVSAAAGNVPGCICQDIVPDSETSEAPPL